MIPADFSIEYPFLKLPYDCGVKAFKTSKKMVEKEMSSVLNSIILLKNSNDLSKENAKEKITTLVDRLKNLKRKLNDNYSEQDKVYETCKKRLVHLNSLVKNTRENQLCYHKTRLNRLIIDFLVREGHIKTAKKMIEQYKIEDLTEIDMKVIMEANEVIADLKMKSCKKALKWCSDNKSKLTRIKSDFEFKLVFQEYIEILREGRKNEAISFLRQHSLVYKEYFPEIKKGFGCLLNSDRLDKFPDYKFYFEQERWDDLIKLFKKQNYNILSLTHHSLFNISLQAGLSSLKTIYCYNENYQRKDKCPVCNKLIQKLAEKLPSTHKIHSTLICRISGEIMDEHNPPIMLPNGEVYSQKAITDIAEKNNGKIYCPSTKMEFRIKEITKIFLA